MVGGLIPPNLTPSNVNNPTGGTVRRTLIHNEQTKIRATILNTIAAGLVVAGIITPLASLFISGAGVTLTSVVLMLIWFVGAIILHSGALLALEALR